MSDSSRSDRDRIAEQTKQHLESLKAAGVEWVPAPPKVRKKPARPLEPPAAAAAMFRDSLADPRASAAAPDVDQRRKELAVLAEQVTGCVKCTELCSTRTQTVFGVGPVDVELCFVGEAPGADEDAQGEPFVGAAGQLLNKIIIACGMKREEVYILNILKCRPPGNRPPLPDEAANCRGFLDRQLELIRPRFLCALGATAAQNLLGTTQSIGKLRGSFQQYNGIPVLCTYHPAYLLRSPEKKREVWEDMKRLLEKMGRPVPQKGQ